MPAFVQIVYFRSHWDDDAAPAYVLLRILPHVVPILTRAVAAASHLHNSQPPAAPAKPGTADAPSSRAQGAHPLLKRASIALALALALGANSQAPAPLPPPLLILAVVDTWLVLKAIDAQAGHARDADAASSRPWLSQLTYHWVFRYLRAEQRQQQHDDSPKGFDARQPPLPRHLHPALGLTRFNAQWQREVASGRASLGHALCRAFARELAACSALRLLVLAKEVVQPVVVAHILHALREHPTGLLPGYTGALALYVGVALVGGLAEQHQIDMRDRMELAMRMALTCAVHRAHTGADGSYASIADLGLVARAQGTDPYSCSVRGPQHLAGHVAKLTSTLWMPLRLAAGIYVFYSQVGWAVAPGIAAALLYLPLRAHLLRRSVDARTRASSASSERMLLLSQLLSNVVPVRMLGWAPVLASRIQSLRERAELDPAIESAASYALLYFARTACRTGGPLASLLVYSMAAHHYARRSSSAPAEAAFVTAERVFIVQTILRELFPLLIDAPHALDDWWAAQKPYTQIQAILRCATQHTQPSKKTDNAARGKDGGDVAAAVEVTNAAFAWPAAAVDVDVAAAPRFALNIASLVVQKQQLAAVVGGVGSGKSSLLLAILGEMNSTATNAHRAVVRGCVAYVSQQPWVMSRSVRENIVFGSAYDEPWFNKVVDLCELQHDLDRWPLGDQTVVGSNGMTLSGGQRMRVALARAVYSRASVYLLDDVLSAVDMHVARRLVDRLLAGTNAHLRYAARIIVTSNPLVLRNADAIYHVHDGHVVLGLGASWWTDVVWKRAIFVKSHSELLAAVVRAPLGLFADASTGSILALFSQGQQDMDTGLPGHLASLATLGIKLLFEAWVIATFHPVLVASVGLAILAMWHVSRLSNAALGRCIAHQTSARPQIDAHIQESVSGAITIRAFDAGHYSERELMRVLSRHARYQWMCDSIETWIDMAMTLLREAASVVAFAIALANAASPAPSARANPALLSLVHLSVTLHLGRLQHLIRHSHPLRASLASGARYIGATRIEHEDSSLPTAAVPESWPARGHIEFGGVSARYEAGLQSPADSGLPTKSHDAPLVLRDMTFTIQPGERVGIVGRTGSGKTSIAMALLGLLRPLQGHISIDGVDIAHVPSAVLCQRLGVVPQATYVLPGTLRENLDPHARRGDQELHRVLELVGLTDADLECMQVDTWSAGQRQLLALARVLLSDAPIAVLDEATASIDAATARRLHAAIHDHFGQRTIITIAHQIESVLGCDRIFVVRDGMICEDITFTTYKTERDLEPAIRLIDQDLSEPYSIYTYRYFVHQWPELCILAHTRSGECAGVIICKLEPHKRRYYEGHFAEASMLNRGYIAMIAVDKPFRKLGIGRNLVLQALDRMKAMGADEVVMEAETGNKGALALYQRLGFIRDKRLYRYYLDGTDAFRLKMWL
ncbi:hypothetical protein LPJ61_001682 [Coemansia biformis]|uniref:P-loop containing nucleoside triphosphate hydrolase protein n=1 Tax=Coemansia biformis TaxID=1286918 RepID=A0A9W8D0D5_9FUNG|nr:hypothetical protein LPJ61_001682 [Coemansia biformis]